MKKLVFILSVMLFLIGTMDVQAQWGKKLLKKAGESAKRATERNVERKVEQTVDKAFEGAEDVVTGKGNNNEVEPTSTTSSQGNAEIMNNGGDVIQQPQQSLEMTYAKSDFVPGDEIIFDDDLAGEQLGEFPSQWDLSEGNAEVANVNGIKAICIVDGKAEIMPLMENPKNYLPDIFTFEMDVYIGDGSYISKEPYKKNQSRYHIYFYTEDGNKHHVDLYDEGENISWSFYRKESRNVDGNQTTSNLVKLNDWNHLAFSFNKRAFKGYVNGTRVINIPNVQQPPVRLMIWDDYSHHCNDFITNIRIAKGAVPLYDRMMSDGKFITYGITFDVGKSIIKPESMGEINRIVKLMTDNPDLRFSVEGHTDSTGNEASNQTLSEARSKAIVDKLVELGIGADRLSASGKGQSSPIADNGTDEGRAKNRRVEFVKM
ncbi:OmpA family protein [Parabacteroides distasonis]|uniref:OmpA family protein n=2 Tax=Parabacteroides distasonis TaxID=823 RepID=UPI0039B56A32